MTPDEIEKAKLSANYLNGLAVAVFAVGVLAPVLSVLNGGVSLSLLVLAVEGAICLAVSVLLHSAGRRVLRKLSP